MTGSVWAALAAGAKAMAATAIVSRQPTTRLRKYLDTEETLLVVAAATATWLYLRIPPKRGQQPLPSRAPRLYTESHIHITLAQTSLDTSPQERSGAVQAVEVGPANCVHTGGTRGTAGGASCSS